MAGIEFLKNLPADKEVQVGVLDIRTMMVETPEQVADAHRARCSSTWTPTASRSSTDCGMKPLPRTIAKMKLKALADGAAIVRAEIS